LTLDHYAQVVTELGEAAAEAMGKPFLNGSALKQRAMDGATDDGGDRARKCKRGPVTRPSLASRVGEI
jgi:hypothetical protein